MTPSEMARIEVERLIAESQRTMLPAESLDWDANGQLRNALEGRCERSILGPVRGHLLEKSRDPETSTWVPVQPVTYYGSGDGYETTPENETADKPWCVHLVKTVVLERQWR